MPDVWSDVDTDSDQGTAVFLLDHWGKFDGADLLEMATVAYRPCESRDDRLIPHVEVDIDSFTAWTETVVEDVRSALRCVHHGDGFGIGPLNVIPKKVHGDWREARRLQRQAGVSNQAIGRPLPEHHPVKDGLNFRSREELKVYEAWVRIQNSLPDTDTIGIVPNCAIRVSGRVREPDFLITYRCRVAALEVDGPHHTGRAAADRSKDQFLSDSGVTFVDRIVVEDVLNARELETRLRKFLERLATR
jgi:hypothetical protein